MDVITSQAFANISGNIKFPESLQEGPHPLTGQRAANFRLLAN